MNGATVVLSFMSAASPTAAWTFLRALWVKFDPPTGIQSLNSAFIIVFAPVFAWLWITLGRRQPSVPTKFAFGLIGAGLGFVILVPAAGIAANGVKVSVMWLTVTYLLHTWGELCISPIGLSAMTKLAPARIVSLIMGVWFLGASVGNYLGGLVNRMGGRAERERELAAAARPVEPAAPMEPLPPPEVASLAEPAAPSEVGTVEREAP